MTSFVAIDFETADYGRDSACAVGAVLVNNGRIKDKFERLIQPPRRDFIFTHIHGLTWEDVQSSPDFAEVWPDLEAFIERGDFLAAHNAPFDRGVLNACCGMAGITAPVQPFVCTVRLARRAWALPSARLPVVCEHLGISLRHHDALSDAEACARIALAAAKEGADILAVN